MFTMTLPPAVAELRHVRNCLRAWARQQRVREWPLTLIVTELVANAIDVTPPGESIEVTVRRLPGGIDVEVVDAGPGLGPDAPDADNRALPPATQCRGRGLYLVGQFCRDLEVTRRDDRTVVRARQDPRAFDHVDVDGEPAIHGSW